MSNKDINYIKGYSHSKFESLYEKHSVLESVTVKYLEDAGFHVESAPYHKTFREEIQKTLHTNSEVNGVYIRSRADRVLVHKATGFTCQLEIKTARYANSKNRYESDILFLEALPLALHVYNSRIGVKTIYVHSDPSEFDSCAFWADDKIIKYIKEIRIPPKQGVNRDYYEAKLKEILGERTPPIIMTKRLSKTGSNDPYAVIDFPAILSREAENLGLLSMVKSAIDEYVTIRPRPVSANCSACGEEIDWSKTQLCPDGCGQLVTMARMCGGCYGFLCNKECFDVHVKGVAAVDGSDDEGHDSSGASNRQVERSSTI